MILIDDRVGSKDLLRYMSRPAELARLDYGDASFLGQDSGVPCLIGIERKRIRDFVNGIVTGRTAGHQLRGLLNHYSRVYFVVEGIWRASPDGLLEIRAGSQWQPLRYGVRAFMASMVWSHLLTLQTVGGCYTATTASPSDTAGFIQTLYDWWKKGPEGHHSADVIHSVEPAMRTPDHRLRMAPPTVAVRIAAQLPCIGAQQCWRVADHFQHNPREMANADASEWMKIRGIGKKSAKEVVKSWKGKEE